MSSLLGLLIGLLLTLFIYSYLLGDNPLYRLALHILVGVAAAYAAVIVVRQIFFPLLIQLATEPTAPATLLWLIPLILALLLLFTRIKPVAWLGNSAVAALVGVGAAVALFGAVTGTLIPQILSVPAENAVVGLFGALFTIAALLYFQFTGQTSISNRFLRPSWQRAITMTGRAILMITFGALFAGVLSTSLVLIVDRLVYMIDQIGAVLSNLP